MTPRARASHLLRSVLHDARTDLGQLLVPTQCAACGMPGVVVCSRCSSALQPRSPVRSRLSAGPPIVSALEYTDVVARVMRCVKDDARPRLARRFAPALSAALADVAQECGESDLRIVGIPARRSSMRARGFRVIDEALAACGVRSEAWLEIVRVSRDQRGLDAGERVRNVAGVLRCAAPAAARGRGVVIVDDVVTSGATLDEACRALSVAGLRVVGAATIAATPRRSHPDAPRDIDA